MSDSSSRTLVLFFDGTSNDYDVLNTNIVKLHSLLHKDPAKQLCYYQAGIGTYFQVGEVSSMFTWLARIVDDAIAWYLNTHVLGGYTFLMENYHEGDKICIFGFSRGAYTARAVAGMLYKVGLLEKGNLEQLSFAYKLYKRTDTSGIQLAAGFKRTFGKIVQIEFMGVWDTISSVGIVMGRTLPFTNSNYSIKVFRHALSLDEHRARFQPNLFHRPSPNPSRDPAHASPVLLVDPVKADLVSKNSILQKNLCQPSDNAKDSEDLSNGESVSDNQRNDTNQNGNGETKTDVLEVWFPGCHTDIGGNEVPDTTKHSLGRISLRWMICQIINSECGIIFDEGALDPYGIDLESSPVTLVKDDLQDHESDASQPLHDQLKLNMFWWILEVIPSPYNYQDGEGWWHDKLSIHLGKSRVIPDHGNGDGPKFHVSVKERMKSLNYKPRAIWKTGSEVYVE
ncbi:hypothetical protein PILCRDRAFT_510080 [Piloderma croceum F 1598]|uniref:T6SS Phospholipase effector Tle1-like catalytic domain-containing protein n=1 Tax=Piloderma croceum (strain F 1598) TaxID=765440 RepID=A0A0C3FMK5_PILCF|nr:hypothetical protein PILCRDRAFT_510080 [Piloderma croceum F 1598]